MLILTIPDLFSVDSKFEEPVRRGTDCPATLLMPQDSPLHPLTPLLPPLLLHHPLPPLLLLPSLTSLLLHIAANYRAWKKQLLYREEEQRFKLDKIYKLHEHQKARGASEASGYANIKELHKCENDQVTMRKRHRKNTGHS